MDHFQRKYHEIIESIRKKQMNEAEEDFLSLTVSLF